jgi:hypothetical protein
MKNLNESMENAFVFGSLFFIRNHGMQAHIAVLNVWLTTGNKSRLTHGVIEEILLLHNTL